MTTPLDKNVANKPQRDAHGRLLPGNTANPLGRPIRKELSLTSLLKELLSDPDGHPNEDARALVKRHIKDAKAGKPDARREAYERVDGKVTLPIEHGVGEGLKELLEGLRANREG